VDVQEKEPLHEAAKLGLDNSSHSVAQNKNVVICWDDTYLFGFGFVENVAERILKSRNY
jgi:hypothetical protein